ncbi:MAG: glycoside hydrolase family 44 protein [Actinomycetota bacterium]
MSSSPSLLRRVRRAAVAGIAVLVAAAGLVATNVAVSAADETIVIYDDGLAPGFQNWSWGTVAIDSTAEVASGSAAMQAELGSWEALYLSAPSTVSLPPAGDLRFSVHGGSNASAALQVQLISPGGGQGPAVAVTPTAGQWTDVVIPLSELGAPSTIEGIWWQEAEGGALAAVHVDDVRIVAGDAPPPAAGPALVVDTGSRTMVRSVRDPFTNTSSDVTITFPHTINDDVYGLNFATNGLREELDVPVNRWGGNSTERYNHRTGSSNAANDWYFATTDGDPNDDHTFENDNQADGAKSILTIPLMGYVSAGGTATCSFPTNDSLGAANNAGPQDASINHWLDGSVSCGNGYVNGEFIGPADPLITSIAVDESWARDWVSELVATHGTAADGGVELYALGNEPGLWHSTHGDIRGDTPIGRQEIIDRNQSYATVIKQADPTAEVIGPVLWSGYSYYVTTPEILAGEYPGKLPTFVGDYLANMAQAEQQGGTRLLDKLAINFYDDRVYGGGSDELRLESPRSLWDPTYAPQDWWVTRDFLEGDGSAVIPRMKSLIDANYPGTGLAITEYNFGGVETLVGALAQADALGIMGREGLDMATLWEPYADWVGVPEDQFGDRPVFWAFRLFRNYDGQGSRFGDQSVFAESNDQSTVSVYAAVRSSDDALTVLAINKSNTAQTTALSIDGAAGPAEQYRYSRSDLSAIERVEDVTVGSDSQLILPARSATLLVLPTGGTDTGDGGGDDGGDGDGGDGDGGGDDGGDGDDGDTGGGDEPGDDGGDDDSTPPQPPVAVEQPAVGAGAELIDAPASMAEGGALDSSDRTWVWAERGPVTLAEPLAVNQVSDGLFRGREHEGSTIPAGTTVCSFRVWADKLEDTGRLSGSMRFADAEVLGIVHRQAEVEASQFLLPPDIDARVGPLDRNDMVTLRRSDDGTYISWNLRLHKGLDGMRVITSCS